MKIRLLVDLDMTLLTTDGKTVPDPAPGTAAWTEARVDAVDCISTAIRHAQGAGFNHAITDGDASLMLENIQVKP